MAGAVPYTPAMKGKMTFVESSYIGGRVTSHKPVYAPAIFSFDESVVVTFVIKSASIEVWLAANTCFDVTKQHRFVTKPHEFVTKPHEFVTKPHEFVIKPHEFVTKPHAFVTKQHSFLTKSVASSQKHLQTSTVKQKEDASWPQNTSEFF